MTEQEEQKEIDLKVFLDTLETDINDLWRVIEDIEQKQLEIFFSETKNNIKELREEFKIL